jgi:hypothetical protein
MTEDPLLTPIREARHCISAEFDHDPRRLVAYYRERERRSKAQGESRFAQVPLRSPTPEEELALRDKPPKR